MLNNEYSSTTAALLRRAELFLEAKEWHFASDYYENVLDIDPENAHAYLGLLLVALKISKESELVQSLEAFDQHKYFLKAVRFADSEYKTLLKNIATKNAYFRVQLLFKKANTAADFRGAKDILIGIAEDIDVEELLNKCKEQEEYFLQKERYEEAGKLMNSSNIYDLEKAIQLFLEDGSEEANLNIEKCKTLILSIEEENKKHQRNKKIAIISAISAVLLLVIVIFSSITSANNKKAVAIYNNFLGQSFSGSIVGDDGFSSAYSNGTLNQYMTYWKTTKKNTLRFNDDGTVYYTSLYDRTVLAYPKTISEPDGYHNEYDGTYSSFSVSVALDGTVYVKIGYHTCEVSVDSNNVPQSIYDYDGMTLR